MKTWTPTERDVEEALVILEKVLASPSTSEADTRAKRRIRVEIRRILSAENSE